MIKFDAGRCFEPAPGVSRWGSHLLGAVINVRAVVNVEDVDNSAALVDPDGGAPRAIKQRSSGATGHARSRQDRTIRAAAWRSAAPSLSRTVDT